MARYQFGAAILRFLGRLKITARQPRQLLVSWAERGGPLVTPPSRTGFGHIVFERLVTKSLNGEVALDFAPEGLSWKSVDTDNQYCDSSVEISDGLATITRTI